MTEGVDRMLRCRHAVLADGPTDDVVLEIADGRIAAVQGARDGSAVEGGEGVEGVETVDGWAVPGFVDTHGHGGGGADYATTDADEIRRALDFHRRHGTTTAYASLVTASLDTLVDQLATLAPLVGAGELSGVHLEGPFLSPARKGAHDAALLISPTDEAIDRLLEAGGGAVRMVTLAPELPGGLAAVERLVGAGVVVAVGHTDADETITRAALDAGATVATHLCNAMPPIHHREPGPVPVLLTDPRAAVELIGDGFHLHPDVVALAVAAAGPQRVVLVTDAMAAAGRPDGAYRIGALDVAVVDGQARLVGADGRPGSIAGSTLTMAAAVEFVVGLGISVPDAAAMAATTPARVHGLATGTLAPGGRADLCVLDDHGRLQAVMSAGEWVEG